MAKIIVSLGDKVLQEIPLSKARMTIGRRADCDVVLDNPAISAEHAVIFMMGGDIFLEDQNSKNGTLVNGVPVKKHLLRHDEVIALAQFRIKYLAGGTDNTVANRLTGDVGGIEVSNTLAIVKILNGESAGKEIALTKLITTIGRPGIHVAVITQRRGGYFLKHVEGNSPPLVNGNLIEAEGYELTYGDVIDLSGARLSFGKP